MTFALDEEQLQNAKVLQIIEGTNQIQRNIIGASLLRAVAKL